SRGCGGVSSMAHTMRHPARSTTITLRRTAAAAHGVHTDGPECHAVIMSRTEARHYADTAAAGPLVDRLLGGLPPEAVLTDPDVTAYYAHDMAGFCPAGAPAEVVQPRTVVQVQHVMRTASALRVTDVPQGACTGLSGRANAIVGCIVFSLTRMDRILEISPVDRIP